MDGHVYHWRHGWIPLTHAAAMAKAKGNHSLAERLVPTTPGKKPRRTPQHLIDYHASRQAQNHRFESHVGGGISAEDTHTQEFKDYFGVGDHSTSGKVEDRITYRTHLQNLSAAKAENAAHQHSYDQGFNLGQQHVHHPATSTATENAQYDEAARRVVHEDDFGQGYGDGLAAAYEQRDSGVALAPITNLHDLTGAIRALPDSPDKQASAAHIRRRAADLGATGLASKLAS